MIKDIVAIANSGGGNVIVGVHNNGTPSGADCAPLLACDQAKIVDKIAIYTGEQFDNFAVRPGRRGRKTVAVIEIQDNFPPMVFVQAGSYDVVLPNGTRKSKIAFNVGTLYFRHGAKSEPADSHDLRRAIERWRAAEHETLRLALASANQELAASRARATESARVRTRQLSKMSAVARCLTAAIAEGNSIRKRLDDDINALGPALAQSFVGGKHPRAIESWRGNTAKMLDSKLPGLGLGTSFSAIDGPRGEGPVHYELMRLKECVARLTRVQDQLPRYVERLVQ